VKWAQDPENKRGHDKLAACRGAPGSGHWAWISASASVLMMEAVDVDQDDEIRLVEAIYVLQKVAELR
jgi:hypothetical protein